MQRAKGEAPRWWAIAFGTVLALLFALQVHIEWNKVDPSVGAAAVATPQVAQLPPLSVTAWVGNASLEAGARTRLHVVARNDGEEPVRNARVVGFESQALRVDRQKLAEMSSALLPAGSYVAWEAELEALDLSGQWILTGHLEWSHEGDGASLGAFPVGPVMVSSPEERSWTIVGARAFYTSAKDLAIPLVLALLAYLFQKLQKERSEEFQSEQARQAASGAIRKEMLQRVHDNASGYLLPVCSTLMGMRKFASLARDCRDTTQQRMMLDKSLSFYFRMRHGMRLLVKEGGGLFFGTRAGEDFIYDCWSRILSKSREHLGIKEPDQVLEMVPAEKLETAFSSHPDPATGRKRAPSVSPAIQKLRERWSRWILQATDEEFQVEVALWQAFYEVVTYEVNRVYEDWYEEPERIPVDSVAGLHGLIEMVEPKTPIAAGVDRYLGVLQARQGTAGNG